MRLRLNTTLRAALIAAFAAVGSSAYADGETEFTTTNAPGTKTNNNFNGPGFVLTLSGSRLSTTSSPADSPISWCDEVNLVSITTNLRNSAGTGVNTGLALTDSTGKVLALSTDSYNTLNTSVTYHFADDTKVSTDSSLYFLYYKTDNDKIKVGYTFTSGDAWSAGAGTGGVRTYSDTTDSITCVFLESIPSTPQTDATKAVHAPYVSIVTTGIPVEPKEYIWVGTGSPALWDTEAMNWTVGGEASQFASAGNSIVNFNAEEGVKDVTVKGDIKAGQVNVNDDYTFTIGEEDSLTARRLAVAGDGSLALAGVGTMTVINGVTVETGGSLSVGANSTLKLGFATAGELLKTITGEGNISLATNVSIAGGTQAAPTTSKATGKLIVEEGKKLTIGSGKGTYVNLTSFSGIELGMNANLETNVATTALRNLTVGEGSHTIHLSDTADYNKVALDLQGTTTLNGDLKLTSGWKYNVNIAALVGTGGLELTGGSESHKVVIGDAAIKTINVGDNMTEVQLNGTVSLTDNLTLKRGTTKVTGTTSVGGELDLSKGGDSNATLTITEGATVNVASTFWGHSGSHLNIEKGGALNLNSDKLGLVGLEGGGSVTSPSNKDYSVGNAAFTLSGVAVTAKNNMTIGNLLTNSSIDAGAHTVSLTNAENMLTGGSVAEGGSLSIAGGALVGSSIENAGNVTLTGEIEIGMMDYKDASAYSGAANAGNGFAKAAYEYSLVTDATKLNMQGATITYFEMDVTDSVKDGKYVASYAETDYSTFYVNKLSETVTKAKSGPETLEAIVVAADGTLEVDQDIDLSLVDSTSTGTLDIAADKTVTAGDATTSTKLAGGGTIVLKSGATNLAGATMTEDWAGTAKVTGTINNIDLNNYGQEGSKVEMNGVSGYFLQAANKEFTPQLVLNGDGLTLTDGFSTLPDKKTYTGFVFDGGVSGEGDMTFNKSSGNVTQHLYFTGDVSDWLGSLSVVKGFTVYAQYSGEEQTVNSAIHRTVGTLNVEVGTGSDADVVTFNRDITADSFTVMQGATANVYDNLTATTIAVNAGGTMNMDGGTLSTAITNNDGTVSLSGITLGNGFEEIGGEDTYVAVDGTTTVTDEDNYYLGNARGYVTVVTGSGEVSGSGITWNDGTFDLQDDGTITTTAARTNFDTFYINKGSENISAIAAHDTTAINIVQGTLVVDEEPSDIAITVSEFGTITGDYADATQVGIASKASAQFTKDVETSGVKFTPTDETDTVMVYNGGDQSAAYSTDNRNMSVSAKSLIMTDQSQDATVSNAVYVDEIVNTTTHALTLDNVEDTLVLVNMEITNSTVQVYTNLAKDTEATVAIAGILQGGGATLKADLTLYGGSTLDVDGGHVAGGTMNALTLGSTLTIDLSQGGLVNLDQDTINALAGLSEGQYLDLIVAADQTKLNYGGSYEGVSYDTLFSATGLTGPYTVYANEGSFGLVKGSQVPEPTTGTLSLLALAALAARRRRK